jgi:flagellar basal-body rod protein FlgF
MSYDIPEIAAAMDRKILQLDTMTNNLANAGTPGFKVRHFYVQKTPEEENKANANPQTANNIFVDFAQGMPSRTDNPLDLCIQGEGFLVVQTKEGQAYTRKGDLTVDKLNRIVTQSGDPVIGEAGPIVLTAGKINISENGSVYVDGNQVGSLKIVDFANRQSLATVGEGLYRDPGTAGIRNVEKPNISSGFIELSNVNIVREMADMIDIHRSFENYQKIIQTLSELDKLSTDRIGRVA